MYVWLSNSPRRNRRWIFLLPVWSPAKEQFWSTVSSKHYSDVEFIVKDKRFLAHKAILAARSSVLKAASLPEKSRRMLILTRFGSTTWTLPASTSSFTLFTRASRWHQCLLVMKIFWNWQSAINSRLWRLYIELLYYTERQCRTGGKFCSEFKKQRWTRDQFGNQVTHFYNLLPK